MYRRSKSDAGCNWNRFENLIRHLVSRKQSFKIYLVRKNLIVTHIKSQITSTFIYLASEQVLLWTWGGKKRNYGEPSKPSAVWRERRPITDFLSRGSLFVGYSLATFSFAVTVAKSRTCIDCNLCNACCHLKGCYTGQFFLCRNKIRRELQENYPVQQRL